MRGEGMRVWAQAWRSETLGCGHIQHVRLAGVRCGFRCARAPAEQLLPLKRSKSSVAEKAT